MTFGKKLRAARKQKGLTQKELAAASHLALRTIQNYESGERMPKKAETYRILADVLGVTEESLKDKNSDFIVQAGKVYGSRGSRQAEELVNSFRIAAAGGELDDNDLEFIKDAMMQTYWDAKRYNQRFRNKNLKEADKEEMEQKLEMEVE